MDEELQHYLDAIEREQCYRVETTLKSSSAETTQKVFFVGKNDCESGPYIRKYFSTDKGVGSGYRRIYEAQRQGRRFVHIPRIFDIYTLDDTTQVVVMEYTKGETLESIVSALGGSADLARELFPSICDAVLELHTSFTPALIHRDIKPSNIILYNNNVTIIDFGIARSFKDGSTSDTTHFGTRAYAPPEQFGFGQTDERSDIYALGMVLYFILTGKTSVEGSLDEDLAREGISPDLASVVLTATMIDPAQRFQSVSLMKDRFQKAPVQSARAAVGIAGLENAAGQLPQPEEESQTAQVSLASQAPQTSQVPLVSQTQQMLQPAQPAQPAQMPQMPPTPLTSMDAYAQVYASSVASDNSSPFDDADTREAAYAPVYPSRKRWLGGLFDVIPNKVKTAWNVFLAVSIALFMVAGLRMIFLPDPGRPEASVGILERFLSYFPLCFVFLPGIAYLMCSKESLSRKIPALAHLRQSKLDIKITVILIVIAFFTIGLSAQFAAN